MDASQIRERFDKLGVWEKAGQRAPHKPLLLLFALGRWVSGLRSDIPFVVVNSELTKLLKEFGPPRRTLHPEYPFWWLQSDGIWAVVADRPMIPRTGSTNPPKRELLLANARGGLTDEVKSLLTAHPTLVTQLVAVLLNGHFPDSLHPDILAAVGLDHLPAIGRRPRDRMFRQRVLTAYEHRCAVCGLDLRLGGVTIALEAAHVRWHQAEGPDQENNGLALCVLHHKTFDLGAWTATPEGVLLVSDQATGTTGFLEALFGYHEESLHPPQRPEWKPALEHLAWHRKQVFKGTPRCTSGKSG